MPQPLKFPEDLNSLRVMISVPSVDGKVYGQTMHGILRATVDLLSHGFRSPIVYQVWQESILPHARNIMLAEFMASDCTDLVCIDADMTWSPEAFLRLLLHPVEIVGAAYRKKLTQLAYNLRWAWGDDNRLIQDQDTGLLEVEGLPFGFIRIRRSAIERMIAELKPRRYKATRNGQDLTVYKLFDLEFTDGPSGPDGDDGDYWGEDLVFCKAWRSIGGKVWCDAEAAVHHIGNFTYEGHIGEWLRSIKTEEEVKAQADADAAAMAKVAAA